MRLEKCIVILTFALSGLWTISLAQQAPASGQVQVGKPVIDNTPDPDDDEWDPPETNVTMRGDGCKPGTVGTVLASDNSFMTLIFDSFIADIGPSATHRKRAFCNVNFTIASTNWTFDVQNVDFRGYYKLDSGVSVTIKTAYKFIGEKGRVSHFLQENVDNLSKTPLTNTSKGRVLKTVDGPVTTDFLVHKSGDQKLKADHPCTGSKTTTLRVRLSALLNSTNAQEVGFVQGDSTDGRFKQLLNIGWRRCT